MGIPVTRSVISFLGERHADTLHDAAFDLALGGKPVDDRARIMRRDVAGDLHMARPGVHFHFGEMGGKALSLDVLEGNIGGRTTDDLTSSGTARPRAIFCAGSDFTNT